PPSSANYLRGPFCSKRLVRLTLRSDGRPITIHSPLCGQRFVDHEKRPACQTYKLHYATAVVEMSRAILNVSTEVRQIAQSSSSLTDNFSGAARGGQVIYRN